MSGSSTLLDRIAGPGDLTSTSSFLLPRPGPPQGGRRSLGRIASFPSSSSELELDVPSSVSEELEGIKRYCAEFSEQSSLDSVLARIAEPQLFPIPRPVYAAHTSRTTIGNQLHSGGGDLSAMESEGTGGKSDQRGRLLFKAKDIEAQYPSTASGAPLSTMATRVRRVDADSRAADRVTSGNQLRKAAVDAPRTGQSDPADHVGNFPSRESSLSPRQDSSSSKTNGFPAAQDQSSENAAHWQCQTRECSFGSQSQSQHSTCDNADNALSWTSSASSGTMANRSGLLCSGDGVLYNPLEAIAVLALQEFDRMEVPQSPRPKRRLSGTVASSPRRRAISLDSEPCEPPPRPVYDLSDPFTASSGGGRGSPLRHGSEDEECDRRSKDAGRIKGVMSSEESGPAEQQLRPPMPREKERPSRGRARRSRTNSTESADGKAPGTSRRRRRRGRADSGESPPLAGADGQSGASEAAKKEEMARQWFAIMEGRQAERRRQAERGSPFRTPTVASSASKATLGKEALKAPPVPISVSDGRSQIADSDKMDITPHQTPIQDGRRGSVSDLRNLKLVAMATVPPVADNIPMRSRVRALSAESTASSETHAASDEMSASESSVDASLHQLAVAALNMLGTSPPHPSSPAPSLARHSELRKACTAGAELKALGSLSSVVSASVARPALSNPRTVSAPSGPLVPGLAPELESRSRAVSWPIVETEACRKPGSGMVPAADPSAACIEPLRSPKINRSSIHDLLNSPLSPAGRAQFLSGQGAPAVTGARAGLVSASDVRRSMSMKAIHASQTVSKASAELLESHDPGTSGQAGGDSSAPSNELLSQTRNSMATAEPLAAQAVRSKQQPSSSSASASSRKDPNLLRGPVSGSCAGPDDATVKYICDSLLRQIETWAQGGDSKVKISTKQEQVLRKLTLERCEPIIFLFRTYYSDEQKLRQSLLCYLEFLENQLNEGKRV